MGNDVPKKNMHYTFIACITSDYVMRIDKNNHRQVYLEECKYEVKNIELKSDSDSDSENVGTKFDTKLMTKLQSGSDNDSE